MNYPLTIRVDADIDLETFARLSGLHPELVARLGALGLIEYDTDPSGRPWFPLDQLAAVARLQRLRSGLSLNYAALGLVAELLDQIAELEAALRTRPRRIEG